MKFLIDAQLPPALAQWLREAGHEARAAREVGLREAEDSAIWRHAQAQNLVIVTKDEDFLDLSVSRGFPPKVVCLAIGNASNAATASQLLQQAETIEQFCSHPEAGFLLLS